jgi:hypothetical protein
MKTKVYVAGSRHLTIRSSQSRFAARLNAGVMSQEYKHRRQ